MNLKNILVAAGVIAFIFGIRYFINVIIGKTVYQVKPYEDK